MEPTKEAEDSGIDSENESRSRRRQLRDVLMMDGHGVHKQPYKLSDVFNDIIEAQSLDSNSDEDSSSKSPSMSRLIKDSKLACDDGRDSPPLLEVELTASDEDDDGSVLELVIPMQRSRYQRVPSQSRPESGFRIFCSIFCCMPFKK